jgi:hypothetical protein
MKKWIGDIDIDVQPNTKKENYGVRAIIYDESNNTIRPHPSGFYCYTNMPIDRETGMASIDYKEAENIGYIKIDLLTNTSYAGFNSKQEVLDSIDREPNWTLLNDESFVGKLPHLASHFEIVNEVSPTSIIELSDVLALIRPGKIHLIESYLKNKINVRSNLYRKPTNGKYYFKKSHSIAYALQIVSIMNLLDVRGAMVQY